MIAHERPTGMRYFIFNPVVIVAIFVISGVCTATDSADSDYEESRSDQSEERRATDFRLAERAGNYAGAVESRRGARAQRDRARSLLRKVQFTILHQLERDPRYNQAAHDMSAARDAYHGKRSEALNRVVDTPAYRDALRKASEVDAHLAAAHADPHTHPEHLSRLARLRLAISSRISELENRALDADPRVAALREDYHAALRGYHGIESQLREQLHTHPDIAASLDRLYDADDALAEARAEAAAARAEYVTADRQYRDERFGYSPYGNHYGYNPRGYVQYPPHGYPYGHYTTGLPYGGGYGYYGGYGHGKGVTISAFGGPWIKAH